jgi:anaerobic ribonucleoside-triphosphate reductase activating protein
MSGVSYLKYILKNVDYLIDGPYIQEQKDLTLSWRSSRNQRIIKSAESMKRNYLVTEE